MKKTLALASLLVVSLMAFLPSVYAPGPGGPPVEIGRVEILEEGFVGEGDGWEIWYILEGFAVVHVFDEYAIVNYNVEQTYLNKVNGKSLSGCEQPRRYGENATLSLPSWTRLAPWWSFSTGRDASCALTAPASKSPLTRSTRCRASVSGTCSWFQRK